MIFYNIISVDTSIDVVIIVIVRNYFQVYHLISTSFFYFLTFKSGKNFPKNEVVRRNY